MESLIFGKKSHEGSPLDTPQLAEERKAEIRPRRTGLFARAGCGVNRRNCG